MSDPPPAPWWLLPNQVALDAPLVAAVWQRFLAGRFGVAVPWAATAALAATVWGIYLADRWLDARRGDTAADRHRAAARHPRAFVGGIVLAGCVAMAAAVALPAGYLQCGAAVGLAVAGYLAVVHGLAGGLRSLPGAKELLVGIGFAAGVAVPLGADGPAVPVWLPAVIAFGAVCWLNCRLIDRWENGPSVPRADGVLGAAALAAAAGLPPVVGGAVAGSVLGLLAVHLVCRHRPRAARALADAVLLTPLVVWGMP
ncbi:MAG TPA: hypothetical protein VH092_15700 [Urbifossiella sp.]|jgi:hypothetical protein|nr:hypothetical protein [Urbifossiella sp.]